MAKFQYVLLALLSLVISSLFVSNLPVFAISVDNSGMANATGSGTSIALSNFVIGNDQNRMLIADCRSLGGSFVPSSVSFGSQSMTQLTTKDDGSGGILAVYYLVSPTISSTHSITCNYASSSSYSLSAMSFFGVIQSSAAFGIVNGTSGTDHSPINTITTVNSSSYVISQMGVNWSTSPSSISPTSPLSLGAKSTLFGGIAYQPANNIQKYTNAWTITGGTGLFWADVSFELKSKNTPSTPTLTHINTLNSTAVQIDFTTVPNASFYLINYTTPATGTTWTQINLTINTKTINGLLAGTQYAAKIAAGNHTGTSAFTPYKSNYTYNIAPTTPAISSITSSQVRLTWTNPSSANLTGGFKIYTVTPLGTNYTLTATTSNNTNHYDLTGLLGNREYVEKISTRYGVGTNVTGASTNSTTVSFYTLPGKPTGLTITQSLPLTPHLSWTPALDNGTVTGTKIERSLDGSTWTTIIANTGNSSSTYNDVVPSSGTYYYRVSTIKYGGTSSPSTSAHAKIWTGYLITIVKADNVTSTSGNIYQSNSTSQNNIFSASTGSVSIPSLFDNQNFTFKDSSTLFVTKKQYNINATSPNTLRIIIYDFFIDCAYTGTGTDFEWFTNGTNHHIIQSFTSPVCYTNNTVKWKVYWQANGNSVQNDTSTVRIQVLNNTFGANPTKLTANGTTIATSYAAPWIISNAFTVGNGNTNDAIYFSANMALNPAYIPNNYTAGNLNVTGSNNNIQPIQITSSTVGSDTVVTFTYPTTYTLGVTANMILENKTASFSGLSRTVVDAAHVSSSITFKNATSNDIIKIKAFDVNSNNNANYSLSMNSGSIPLLTQIANFRNGTYGTQGQFGSIDLIVLIVLIFSMIGLNRVSETVGLIFNVIVIGGFSFYGILPFDKTIYAGIAFLALIIVGSTKKLPWS